MDEKGTSPGGVTRRRLIGAAAARAAARPAGPRRGRDQAEGRAASGATADVVVVGAGLAGLTAARDLVAAGQDGRRTRGARPGRRAGAQRRPRQRGDHRGRRRVHRAHPGPHRALAKDVGVETFPTYNTGDNLYFRNGTATPYSSSGPLGPVPPDPTGAVEAEKAILQLDQMAKTIPLDAPWTAPNAKEWDSQTFETWKLANVLTPAGRFLLDVAITSIFSAEPRDVSLLFVLFYIAAAGNETNPGNIERLVNTGGGAQERRFVGGSQLVPIKLAERLGERVVLSRPVRRIVTENGAVTAVADGYSVDGQARHRRDTAAARRAHRLQPAAARAARPAHPAHADGHRDEGPRGLPQAVLARRRPHRPGRGRHAARAGDVRQHAALGHARHPHGLRRGRGRAPATGRSRDDLRRDVLKNFSDYFGPQAANPTSFHVSDWQEEVWTRGCPVCFTAPGVLLDYGRAIREPVGRIHWAGTETSTFWNGYMDGAVRSGERAAKEVVAAL